MSFLNLPAMRSSACSIVAVIVISVLAWSFESHRSQLRAADPELTAARDATTTMRGTIADVRRA